MKWGKVYKIVDNLSLLGITPISYTFYSFPSMGGTRRGIPPLTPPRIEGE